MVGMIAYEELCAALERYRQAQGGGEAAHAEAPTITVDHETHEHAMPPVGHHDEDHTNVGVQPIYDDRSNELDIGDVLSDEEAPKN